jgi:hypothetical protein
VRRGAVGVVATEEESRERERVAVGKRREGWARVRGW